MANVALVTGASRGIGRASALALAQRGFDVAITARTMQPGDPTALAPESGVMLPGSLAETAGGIRQLGRRCQQIRLDLLDEETLAPVIDETLSAFGRLDVLVNNAIYVGPGNTDLFVDVDPEHIVKRIWCNLTAQLLITQRALQVMSGSANGSANGTANGTPRGGRIINISSQASFGKAMRLSESGASGVIYSAAKAGLNRLAVCLSQEHENQGIEIYSVDPGLVITERVEAAGARLRLVTEMGGEAPEPVGKAIAWLAENGIPQHDPQKIIFAQELAREQGFL